MTSWSQYSFQEGVSPIMEEFILFHDLVLMLLIFIMSLVGVVMAMLFSNKLVNVGLLEGQVIEWIWTFIPGIILMIVALPSISLLYMYDEVMTYDISFKVLGNQWYWSYEYINFGFGKESVVSYDSYMISSKFLSDYEFRLLEVDNSISLPYGFSSQVTISSKDVLHSWTIPSMGVKVDAVPGRLNMLSLMSFRPGIFFGQCSEICGAQHSFMPIVLEMLSLQDWLEWLMLLEK